MFESIVRRRRAVVAVAAVIVLAGGSASAFVLGSYFKAGEWRDRAVASPAPASPSALASTPAGPAPTAEPPPAGLAVLDYDPFTGALPADPAAMSTEPVTEALQVERNLAAYDKPGGRAVVYVPPDIRGVPLTVPIVARDRGWVAVMVPSANRRMAWLPPDGWTSVALTDQIIVERATHTLTWLRGGVKQKSWQVTLGMRQSPTPLGRTFIIGRSSPSAAVYAGTAVFALGAIPDDVNSVPSGLRGAHIGIHTWHNDRALGKDTSDGCIRLTKSGQQELLAAVKPGTEVVVVDRL